VYDARLKPADMCLVVTMYDAGYPQQQPAGAAQPSYPPPGSYPPQQQPSQPDSVKDPPPPGYSDGRFTVVI